MAKRKQPTEKFQIDPIHSELNIYDEGANPIIRDIWYEKYRWHGNSNPENTPADTHSRFVEGVYAKDQKRGAKAEALEACQKLLWLPGGRIQASAGTNTVTTMINCFVSRTIKDSMSDIMEAHGEAALTMQQGGGIGMDFSTLRPMGAYLNRTGAVASGPLPFMDMWDSMCQTIKSAGGRRGAMMATMCDTHPDLPQFITAKREKGRLTNFNVSVLVSDAFMDAVKQDEDWYLGFEEPRADGQHLFTMQQEDGSTWYAYSKWKARDLWDAIIKNTYEWAEPGVVFIDRINQENNLEYCEDIRCTNPCGEQPLPPFACCNLGAVNLARMVTAPFTDEASFDYELLRRIVRIGVRFLDNVIDTTIYPLTQQRDEEFNKRRIGLGITGLANALSQLGLRYGSGGALVVVDEIMQMVKESAYEASADLAKERGSFPLYTQHWGKTSVVNSLPARVKRKIQANGIRNGVLLTIAPTGTTSLFAGNVSSGLEPVFLHRTKRRVVQKDNSIKYYLATDYSFNLYCHAHGFDPEQIKLEALPAYMDAHDKLGVDEHLATQAVCQSHIDASVSKTINCPKEMSFEDFGEVYTRAYSLGLKGCTTYRPSDVRGAVLAAVDDDTALQAPQELTKRPDVLSGNTYKLRWPHDSEAYYLTVNGDAQGPREIFISSTSSKYTDWATALCLMISAVMRKGGDISFIPEELKKVKSPDESGWIGGKYHGSLVALIGDTLANHLNGGSVQDLETTAAFSGSEITAITTEPEKGEVCPNCGAPTLIPQEGCKKCTSCGYSTCG